MKNLILFLNLLKAECSRLLIITRFGINEHKKGKKIFDLMRQIIFELKSYEGVRTVDSAIKKFRLQLPIWLKWPLQSVLVLFLILLIVIPLGGTNKKADERNNVLEKINKIESKRAESDVKDKAQVTLDIAKDKKAIADRKSKRENDAAQAVQSNRAVYSQLFLRATKAISTNFPKVLIIGDSSNTNISFKFNDVAVQYLKNLSIARESNSFEDFVSLARGVNGNVDTNLFDTLAFPPIIGNRDSERTKRLKEFLNALLGRNPQGKTIFTLEAEIKKCRPQFRVISVFRRSSPYVAEFNMSRGLSDKVGGSGEYPQNELGNAFVPTPARIIDSMIDFLGYTDGTEKEKGWNNGEYWEMYSNLRVPNQVAISYNTINIDMPWDIQSSWFAIAPKGMDEGLKPVTSKMALNYQGDAINDVFGDDSSDEEKIKWRTKMDSDLESFLQEMDKSQSAEMASIPGVSFGEFLGTIDDTVERMFKLNQNIDQVYTDYLNLNVPSAEDLREYLGLSREGDKIVSMNKVLFGIQDKIELFDFDKTLNTSFFELVTKNNGFLVDDPIAMVKSTAATQDRSPISISTLRLWTQCNGLTLNIHSGLLKLGEWYLKDVAGGGYVTLESNKKRIVLPISHRLFQDGKDDYAPCLTSYSNQHNMFVDYRGQIGFLNPDVFDELKGKGYINEEGQSLTSKIGLSRLSDEKLQAPLKLASRYYIHKVKGDVSLPEGSDYVPKLWFGTVNVANEFTSGLEKLRQLSPRFSALRIGVEVPVGDNGESVQNIVKWHRRNMTSENYIEKLRAINALEMIK